MPYQVQWRPPALEQLLEIIEYVGQRNQLAATKLFETLRGSTDRLAEFPELYPVSRFVPGQRQIVAHPNYIVLYEIDRDRQLVSVTTVTHSRRRR